MRVTVSKRHIAVGREPRFFEVTPEFRDFMHSELPSTPSAGGSLVGSAVVGSALVA